MAGFSSSVDTHPDRNKIISEILAGETARSLASRYGLSEFAIGRYKRGVIRPALQGRQPTVKVEDKLNTVQQVNAVKSQMGALIQHGNVAVQVQKRLADYDRILAKAEATGDLGAWSSVDKSETAKLRLMAELSGELQPQANASIQVLVVMPQAQSLDSIGQYEDAIDIDAEAVS